MMLPSQGLNAMQRCGRARHLVKAEHSGALMRSDSSFTSNSHDDKTPLSFNAMSASVGKLLAACGCTVVGAQKLDSGQMNWHQTLAASWLHLRGVDIAGRLATAAGIGGLQHACICGFRPVTHPKLPCFGLGARDLQVSPCKRALLGRLWLREGKS